MPLDISHLSFPSPIGALTLFAECGSIIVIEAGRVPDSIENDPLLNEARDQLNAYFDGKLTTFDLPVAPVGPPRRREIWEAMAKIPYGTTLSYGEFAAEIKSSARAIGGACSANPIPIVVPCHRVLAADGKMGGFSFANGAETKRQLLQLEGACDINLTSCPATPPQPY
jgi:methylated-DNA-[protein]-cysteine S-methyltransferase